MNHLFLTYKLAVLAKDNGIDLECVAGFDKKEKFHYGEDYFYASIFAHAPMYQQIIDWFYDSHKIDIVFSISKSTGKFKYTLVQFIDGNWQRVFNPVTFYDRDERNVVAIKEAFKLIGYVELS